MNDPRVFAPVGRVDSSAMWRVCQPFNYLAERGYPCSWNHMTAVDSAVEAVFADMVILPRLYWHNKKGEDAYIGHLRSLGKVVVWECDDDMFSWNPYMSAAWTEDERRKWGLWAGKARRVVRKTDGVIVSTERLRTRVMGVVRESQPVLVTPNLIHLGWWRSVLDLTRRDDPSLSIGWTGAKRNPRDLDVMLAAWSIVATRCPQVRFVTVGHHFEEFDKAVPPDRHTHYPWTSLQEYPAACKQVDIGCAPLAPSLFNGCKAPIKVMEYVVGGAAVVASPTVYEDHFGPDGLIIARTVDEWAEALVRLVGSEDERRKRWNLLFSEVVTRHSLEYNAKRIVSTWRRMVEAVRPLNGGGAHERHNGTAGSGVSVRQPAGRATLSLP